MSNITDEHQQSQPSSLYPHEIEETLDSDSLAENVSDEEGNK